MSLTISYKGKFCIFTVGNEEYSPPAGVKYTTANVSSALPAFSQRFGTFPTTSSRANSSYTSSVCPTSSAYLGSATSSDAGAMWASASYAAAPGDVGQQYVPVVSAGTSLATSRGRPIVSSGHMAQFSAAASLTASE